MAIIVSSLAQRAVNALLRERIALALKQGNLSSTDEMIGYSLAGQDLAVFYNPKPTLEIKRKVAAPEALTGLISEQIT